MVKFFFRVPNFCDITGCGIKGSRQIGRLATKSTNDCYFFVCPPTIAHECGHAQHVASVMNIQARLTSTASPEQRWPVRQPIFRPQTLNVTLSIRGEVERGREGVWRGRACRSTHGPVGSRSIGEDPSKVRAISWTSRATTGFYQQQPNTAERSWGDENKHREGGDAETKSSVEPRLGPVPQRAGLQT